MLSNNQGSGGYTKGLRRTYDDALLVTTVVSTIVDFILRQHKPSKRKATLLLAGSISFAVILELVVPSAYALFNQCPPIGYADGCSILIEITPTGKLKFYTDSSIRPYDDVEDTLVGVINNSGSTVFGISLTGEDIFGFDGDGAGDPSGSFWGSDSPHGPFPGGPFGDTGYEGPSTSFTVQDGETSKGIVNFKDGLCSSGSTDVNCVGKPNYLWFSLEGAPSQIKLTSSVTIDPGHGTNCPPPPQPTGKEVQGAVGVTNYPATNPPPGKLREDILAAAIALDLRDKLETDGYTVIMTKTDSATCRTFAERVQKANDARSNMFVSVHLNGKPTFHGISLSSCPFGAGCGTSVLYDPAKTSAQTLAQFIVGQVASDLGVANRGTEAVQGYAVLRPTTSRMTAVIVEVARLVPPDEDIMHDPASIGKAANGIFSGIDAFVNQ